MLEIFGKAFRLDTLIYSIIWISSIVIIALNMFYFLKFSTVLIDSNMVLGFVLFVFSAYNLFIK